MTFAYKKITIFILVILIIGGFSILNRTYAAEKTYKINVTFPCEVTGPCQTIGHSEVTGPAQYIKAAYFYSLGLGALLAVLLVVIGGIRYTVSEAVPNKEDAKKQISSAIWGLVLLLAAYLILSTINPELDIANLEDPGISKIQHHKYIV